MISGIGIAARGGVARKDRGRAAMTDFAATFRDADQNMVGTTWAGTICWAPRKPSKMAAYSTERDEETIIRCGHCVGCREFDRQRLAKRLDSHYRHSKEDVWIVMIECTLERQSKLSATMRRTKSWERRGGFLRLSPGGLAFIAVGPKPHVPARLTSTISLISISKVRLSRGLRAWRELTAGMLVPRDEWGEQRNRFYHRGLPSAPKEHWEIATGGGLRKRAGGLPVGVRARRGAVSLAPPGAWKPPRLLRQRGPVSRRFATPSPIAESIAEVILGLRVAPASVTTPIKRGAAKRPLPASSLPGFRTARSATAFQSTELSLESEGYRSSRHSDRAEIDAWLARMLSKRRDGP